MIPSHILWDFNGTVLDDVEPCIKSINALLIRHGLDPIPDRDEYQKVFGFPVSEYYKRVGFDFDKTSFDILAVEWVELYNRLSTPLKLCPNIEKALSYAAGLKIPQLILTASDTEMAKGQLKELGVDGYFDGIIGNDNIKAHGKSEIAAEWNNKVKPERAVLIGDTEHDAQVADLIGAECVLVSCGHMAYDRLAKLKPVYNDPYEAIRSIL